jgi:hypothetical protein
MNSAHGQSAGKDLILDEKIFHHLAGFVDGEGAFPIQMRRTFDTKFGFTITPEFKISQHKDYGEILEILQKAIECGKISVKSGQPNLFVLVEKNRKNLIQKVIPFFNKYPLIVKRNQFRLFSEIVKGLENNEHLTREGYEKLVNLVFQTKGKGKRKYSKEEVLSNPQRPYVGHK